MKISEFIEKLQKIQEESGDIDMALEDADTDLLQSLDVVLEDGRCLRTKTINGQRYCVIPCAAYWREFL